MLPLCWLLLACPSPDVAEPEPVSEHPTSSGVPLVAPRDADLQERLDALRRAASTPRTRHRHDDGTPQYVNRLATADSDYLRQHAHNPVDWFPWGDEAFALAEKLNRPVLLSVGYATCHWCHVMEEESFEDPELAAYINAHYVPVKVDREELPHVDRAYMAAVHAMGLRGGWPMTVWLTPNRRPYYAATYLPARDGDRDGMRGLLTALQQLITVWNDEQDQLANVSADLVAKVRQQLAPPPPAAPVTPEEVHALTERWLRQVDPVHGGMKGAPSFPGDLPVRWLLSTDGPHAQAARGAAVHTLRQLHRSGLHDVLAGGFHRYSVDETWDVPHFEKTLYDNAVLADLYLLAWQRTGDEELLATARRTLAFLEEQLATPSGAYASALDADSVDPATGERLEGRTYTWTREEVVDVVGPAAPEALRVLGVTGEGAIEGRHVLRRAAEPAQGWEGPMADAIVQLRVARDQRPAPAVDTKVVVAWNALAIRALAHAGTVLQAPGYLERARRVADAVWTGAHHDGRLRRLATPAAPPGELDDHALLCAAYLDLFESDAHPEWLRRAQALDATIEAHFADPAGGWFATADDAPAVLVRAKPRRDDPHPSGASTHLESLLRLAALTGDDRYRQRLEHALAAYAGPLRSGQLDHGLLAVQGQRARVAEIVIVVPSFRGEAKALLEVVARHAPTHHVRLVVPDSEVASVAEAAPIVGGKTSKNGAPVAFVCERGRCLAPVTEPADLRRSLTTWHQEDSPR